MKNQNKTLFLIELPPPMHGMTYVNNIIYETLKEDKNYYMHNLDLSSDISEIGKKSFSKVFKNFKLIINAWKSFISYRPNQVYIVLSASLFGLTRDLLILLPSILFNKKRIVHLHGFTYYDKCNESVLYKSIFQIICLNSKIIVLCNKQRDVTFKVLKKDSYVVYNPLSQNLGSISKKLEDKKIKLLYISSISKLKGTFDLIKSIKDFDDVELTIAGNFWTDEDEFFKLIEKFRDKVHFIGFADENKKQELLSSHDIFCIPSRLSEGSPISIIEAMAYGLPIISTNKGCIAEMIKDCGVVIDGFLDYEKMNFAVDTIKQDYESFSKKSIEKYMTHHDKAVFINTLQGVIDA